MADPVQSYLSVTAATLMEDAASDLFHFVDIHTALLDTNISLRKLQWQAGVNNILLSQKIQILKDKQKNLSRMIQNFSMALADIISTSLKDMSEEETAERQKACSDLYTELEQTKNKLLITENQITELADINEDVLLKLRSKMAVILKNINTLQEAAIGKILTYLASQPVSLHEDIKKDLSALIKASPLEAQFLTPSKNKKFDFNAALNALIKKYDPHANTLVFSDALLFEKTEEGLTKNYAMALNILKEQGKKQSELPLKIPALEEMLENYTTDIHEHIPKIMNMMSKDKLARYLGEME